MKRDVAIHAVENGWVVRDATNFREPVFSVSTDGTMKGTWVFNSTADLVRDLPAILETEAGSKPNPLTADEARQMVGVPAMTGFQP